MKLITTITGGNETYKVIYDKSFTSPYTVWRCNNRGELVTRMANRKTEKDAREKAAQLAQGN